MLTNPENSQLKDFLGSAEIFTSAVNDLMAQQLKEITGTDVTYSQLKLLKMVAATGGYSVSNLAQFMGVSTAAASRAVDRLVKRGLLDRAEAVDDRRAVQLSLTQEGTDLLDRYDQAADLALRTVFQSMTPEKLRETGDLLDRLSVKLVETGNGSNTVCFRCGIHFRDRCLLRKTQRGTCLYHLERGPPASKE